MPEFDVHFMLSGIYAVEAYNAEDATATINNIIKDRIQLLDDVLRVSVGDPLDQYVVMAIVKGCEEECLDVPALTNFQPTAAG